MQEVINSITKIRSKAIPVVAALVFTSLIILMTGNNPLEVFISIGRGATMSQSKLADILVAFIPLMLVTGGVVITFTAGLWNIGVEGQIILGAIGSIWVIRLLEFSSMPVPFIILMAVLAGGLGGAIWAGLAAALKHFSGVSEIFAGLGLNYIASAITNWLIFGPWKRPGVASMSGTVPFDNHLWLPTLPGLRISVWAMVVLCLIIVLVYVMLKKTMFGLRVKAVGLNASASMHQGISSRRVVFSAFLTCGAIAGLTGAYLVLGVFHRLIPAISSGYGFLGLMIGMLVNYQVIAAIPVALFFAGLNIGSIPLPLDFRLDSTLSGVIQSSLVLFFLLAGKFTRNKTKSFEDSQ